MAEEKRYSSKEVAEILGVSVRTVRRYLNNYISQEGQSYQVSQEMLDILKTEYLNEENQEGDIIVQEFTNSEYEEFHRRLSEYPLLKDQVKIILNELEYHKKSAESHNRQMEIILNNLQQRNFIEAKEKGLDEE